jgi:hypothetical protein
MGAIPEEVQESWCRGKRQLEQGKKSEGTGEKKRAK